MSAIIAKSADWEANRKPENKQRRCLAACSALRFRISLSLTKRILIEGPVFVAIMITCLVCNRPSVEDLCNSGLILWLDIESRHRIVDVILDYTSPHSDMEGHSEIKIR